MPKLTGEAGETSRRRLTSNVGFSILRVNFKSAVSWQSLTQSLTWISVSKGANMKTQETQVSSFACLIYCSRTLLTGAGCFCLSLPAWIFPFKWADLQHGIVGWISSASFILKLSVPLSLTLLAALFITCNHNNWSFSSPNEKNSYHTVPQIKRPPWHTLCFIMPTFLPLTP